MKEKLRTIIFGYKTPSGKLFDVCLLWAIVLSVFVVICESVGIIRQQFGFELKTIEWFFTIVFTFEYALRIYCSKDRLNYIFSFFGLIDLLSIIPTYLSIFIDGSQSLIVIRGLRLLRVFRILKIMHFSKELNILVRALKQSQVKIFVFLGSIVMMVLILGTLMYLIEGPENGFTNIPISMYWAVVTLTTVGYGDISPHTPIGQLIASLIMLMGYGLIAVPTGIFSVELSQASRRSNPGHFCSNCTAEQDHLDAKFCWKCGKSL